jgi:hypothetical protein
MERAVFSWFVCLRACVGSVHLKAGAALETGRRLVEQQEYRPPRLAPESKAGKSPSLKHPKGFSANTRGERFAARPCVQRLRKHRSGMD